MQGYAGDRQRAAEQGQAKAPDGAEGRALLRDDHAMDRVPRQY